jgi:ectonucleotide pyrophosphatase/phosphodiesterase family protein 5
MWPGSNHPYGQNETLPTHFQRWNGSWTFENRVDLLVEMITDPETPANIVFLYLEEPDNVGHAFGPDSEEIKEQVEILDERVGYLISKLKELTLFDKVNIVLLSDHGFVEIEQSKIMNVTGLVDPSLFTRRGGSPVWHIYPEGDNEGNRTQNSFSLIQ